MPMSTRKISFDDSLVPKVIESRKCVSCGACIVACPFNCLEYAEEKPNLIKECKNCGICAKVCPRYEWSLSEAEELAFRRKRKPKEEYGVCHRLLIAQAKNKLVSKVCQDGGVVTALLLFALETKIIDGAVVSEIDLKRPFYPIPKLATNAQDLLKAAGTRYSWSPNILALYDVVNQKKNNVAFVGTPCHIRALRKIQITRLKKLTNPLKFFIGLMCSESFAYKELMENYIQKKLDINLRHIKKINIKGKMIVTTDTEVTTIPLKEVKQYAQASCHFCKDFSSELADISVGGLGLEGWTFIIIRSEKGEKLISNAEKAGFIITKPVEEGIYALRLLKKLTLKKKSRSIHL